MSLLYSVGREACVTIALPCFITTTIVRTATGGVLIWLVGPKLERTPAPKVAGFFLLVRTMELDFQKSDGLITAVIQDYQSGRVLMVGYMNERRFDAQSIRGSPRSTRASRKKLWMKGRGPGTASRSKRSPRLRPRRGSGQGEAIGPGVLPRGLRELLLPASRG
jgi:hypothetical protein